MNAPIDHRAPLGRGRYSAVFLWLLLPNASLVPHLPEGFRLAECPFVEEGSHPLMLSIGRQSGVCPARWPGAGWSYNEAIVTLPWVRHQGRLCTLPVKLWLDRRRPVWLGWAYGFPKVHSPVQVGPDRAEVPGAFALRHTPVSGPARPRLRDSGVLAGLGQTLVGCGGPGGQPTRSWMDWKLDQARLRCCAVQLDSSLPWLPSLALGERSARGLAFHMTHDWTLTAPERT